MHICTGPPFAGLSSSSSEDVVLPDDERRPFLFSPGDNAAARANARPRFAGSCIALVHTSIACNSSMSGDFSGVGFATSFDLDIV